AVASAVQFFSAEEYENARTNYRSALEIKPEETYPQQRIDEISNLLDEIATARRELELQNKAYQEAVQLADNYFEATNYGMAKTNYQKAASLKPEENYPVRKIEEIDELLKQQKIDEEYRTIVVAADGYFKTSDYDAAKQEYENALALKPNEEYVKDQLAKINTILEKEQQKLLAAQQAESDMERRRTDIAQQQEQVLQENLSNDSELSSLYDEYIRTADENFDGKRYNVSRAWYYQAWDVKPEETYPPQRINEINKIVSGLMLNQRDRDYQRFINLADSTFRENQLAVARAWYNQALNIKVNETYPREQLQAIEARIAERMASQSGEQFNNHVEKAEKAFDTQNYNVARFWYKKALELRPNEQEVKNRLSEIENNLQ
ncbi:MAG TPA: hypothetical protein VKA10_09035, partial [Prolixibacteraceae bacterium]|nr:hypothetical protein [Prolixibacteraceae bacterium]